MFPTYWQEFTSLFGYRCFHYFQIHPQSSTLAAYGVSYKHSAGFFYRYFNSDFSKVIICKNLTLGKNKNNRSRTVFLLQNVYRLDLFIHFQFPSDLQPSFTLMDSEQIPFVNLNSKRGTSALSGFILCCSFTNQK